MFKLFNAKEIGFIFKKKHHDLEGFTLKTEKIWHLAVKKSDSEFINKLYKQTEDAYVKEKLETLLMVGYVLHEETSEFSNFEKELEQVLPESIYHYYYEVESLKEDTEMITISKKERAVARNIYESGDYKSMDISDDVSAHLWDLFRFGSCKKLDDVVSILKEFGIGFKLERLDSAKNQFKKILERAKLNIVVWTRRVKHIASVSGGKDSCYMVIKMLEAGMPIDELLFMDTGLEFPEMYSYLDDFEKYIGMKINRITPERNFREIFYSKVSSGKNEGKIYGWPFILGAWCNSRLKVSQLKKYLNGVGDHISYIGIAYNEPDRYLRLKWNEKAPLFDMKIDEKQVVEEMNKLGILNPLYEKFDRLGCYLCPKQNLESLRTVRREYPELWAEMLAYDLDSPVSFKPNATLHDLDRRFAEEEKTSIIHFPQKTIEPVKIFTGEDDFSCEKLCGQQLMLNF